MCALRSFETAVYYYCHSSDLTESIYANVLEAHKFLWTRAALRGPVSNWASLIQNHGLVCLECSKLKSSANTAPGYPAPPHFQAVSVPPPSHRPTFSFKMAWGTLCAVISGKELVQLWSILAVTLVKWVRLPSVGVLTGLDRFSPSPRHL